MKMFVGGAVNLLFGMDNGDTLAPMAEVITVSSETSYPIRDGQVHQDRTQTEHFRVWFTSHALESHIDFLKETLETMKDEEHKLGLRLRPLPEEVPGQEVLPLGDPK